FESIPRFELAIRAHVHLLRNPVRRREVATKLLRRSALATAVCVGTLGAAVSATAAAGTFEVTTCGEAPDSGNRSWSSVTSGPTQLTASQACPPSDTWSGLVSADSLGGPNADTGSSSEWR